MIGQYREVLYGLAFGLGASAIDIAMHVHLESHSVQEEVTGPHAWITLAYRGMFIVFGLAVGWLLWKKSQREREFRNLSELLKRLRREVGAPAVLMHANLQLLLTRDDLRPSGEAEKIVRFLYEQSQHIQSAIKGAPEVG
ncbi:MAG TPA: hypothetical protein VNK82_07695 [Terriglobales bacterium]|nr:hypothetical protein [Terriglobales bacterium]